MTVQNRHLGLCDVCEEGGCPPDERGDDSWSDFWEAHQEDEDPTDILQQQKLKFTMRIMLRARRDKNFAIHKC